MKKKQQQVLVVCAAIAVIIISSLVTLSVTGTLGSRKEAERPGYQNVTFTDAVQHCERETRERYLENIATLYVDDHSSRFDNKSFVYKIFMKMELRQSKGSLTTPYYVTCFVRAKNGSVTKYDVLNATEKSESPVSSDNTNMFGIPKR